MRKVNKKDLKNLSQVLIILSVLAVILSGLGYMGTDIWLASTQWLLVANSLGIFGIYLRLISKD